MDTYKQIEFWDFRVFPIYSRAKKCVRDWIDHALPKVKTNRLKKYPVSDITFSILDRGDQVNPSRFAIGIFNPKIEDYEMFNDVSVILTRRRLFVEPSESICLLGIGEDIKAGEDKFYIYTKNPWTKKIYITAYTFRDGELVERKFYKPISRGYEGTGSRGSRKQINYELEGEEAVRLVRKLPISSTARRLAVKILNSGLFALDTVSFSKKRGIALYFD